MKCWDKFDSVVCLHYAPHKDRVEDLKNELKRIGLFEKTVFHLSSRGFMEDEEYKVLGFNGYRLPQTPAQFNSTSSHIAVIRGAYESGANNLLVLEDDIRFLKDVGEISRLVGMEHNYDLCLYDRFLWHEKYRKNPMPNFLNFDDSVRGASMYYLNREGMKAILDSFDMMMSRYKSFVLIDVLWDYAVCRKGFTGKCVCVQKDFDSSMNFNVFRCKTKDVYINNGVDLSLYNL